MATIPKRKRIETHETRDRQLIKLAEEQLAKGNKYEASEKAWEAVAHQIVAIADKRGWKYDTHDQFFDTVAKITRETDDPEWTDILFSTAHALRQNYHADSMPLSYLRGRICRTKELLKLLNRPTLFKPKSDTRKEWKNTKIGPGKRHCQGSWWARAFPMGEQLKSQKCQAAPMAARSPRKRFLTRVSDRCSLGNTPDARPRRPFHGLVLA